MKSIGIVRRIDELGRVVIPKEIRRSHGWEPGTPMEMFMSDEGLLIRGYKTEEDKLELIEDLMALKMASKNVKYSAVIQKAIEHVKKS
ncbi:AbrB/MazE/SpoVT family DNA-binding domain-containing protein [Evansella tamaricis]|uniref:AbrB/MazE/SpoVT family DNA-binding domain-containing protein n=1 Tax=Evansella tamaricis TaxID=2069301 RepID=A0ABS6JBQ1_9BACI|nr:AbrB/MazE/SpoVT family DNA-binding domain-containing protein [Evansella tamaricis]MBU9711107.1 AbrB/MazE/SpoVT family DNA-binding domain-containing protein [Evansella tamaricis]